MYIPAAAVEALLAFIRNASGPGSGFVAEFLDRSVVDGTSSLPEAQALKGFVEQEGAALKFGFDEDGVQAYLKARGFSGAETVNAKDLKAKFFPAAGPDRRVSPMFNFVTATVYEPRRHYQRSLAQSSAPHGHSGGRARIGPYRNRYRYRTCAR